MSISNVNSNVSKLTNTPIYGTNAIMGQYLAKGVSQSDMNNRLISETEQSKFTNPEQYKERIDLYF